MSERVEQRLGNYLLRRLVGTGAFADVYLGSHIYLNTQVAIKALHSHVNARTWESFLAEARHLSHLGHPHIIHVLDFGIEEEDPFLVMEYAPGGNLRQRHPPGSVLPLASVVAYLKTIAAALHYTHRQHLIHRDLKPENLLVGAQSEILLSDFGLALISAGGDELRVQESLGTLAYMAPEQLNGLASPASDQYALAVMAYEWLSGRRPFEETSEQQPGQRTFAAPAPLSGRHAEVSPELEGVVFKALSKNASLRFADVLSFATAFEEASYPHSAALRASPRVITGNVYVAEQATAALSGPQSSPQNLPVPLTPLIGRERELDLACTRLLRPEVRLLTLIGSPGVGKTHMALALGAQMQQHFEQGVSFVPLAAINDPSHVIPTILRALGQPVYRESTSCADLASYLLEKQHLLVLDTFEQVLTAAPLLTEILSACPQLKILVTSRAALHVQGEYELAVPPLALPDLRELPPLASLSQVAAIALFVDRAEALKEGFALTEGNAALVAELCVRLGGVPLAIELAAARCKLLSLEAVLARLTQGLEVLTGGHQNVHSRQQTVRNTLAWSYNLLSSEEQLLFRSICVFAGDFTLAAVEVVALKQGVLSHAVLDGVISLLDKSLLQQREGEKHEPRLYLLEIIRAYGMELLREQGELESCQQAQAAYSLALAERGEGRLWGEDQIAWLGQLELEYEGMREALRWLLAHHEVEAALRLSLALRRFWYLRGHVSEGRAFLEQALEASRQIEALNCGHLQARALYAVGYLASCQHDPAAASYLVESLALFRRLADKSGIAACLSRLGVNQYTRGEIAQGQALIEESLALALSIKDKQICADSWLALGTLSLYEGRFIEARQQLEEGLALSAAEDDPLGMASGLHELGVTCYFQQDHKRARRYFEESLALLRKLNNPCGTSATLTLLACAQAAEGETIRASALIEEALKLALTREHTDDLAGALFGAALQRLWQGQFEEACACLEEALTKLQGNWFDPLRTCWLAGCLELLAESALTRGYARWATQLCAAAETIRVAHVCHSPPGREQARFERTLAETRRLSGDKAFTAAWAQGLALSPQGVLAARETDPPRLEAPPHFSPSRRAASKSDLPGGLTAREVEVLRFLAEGLSNHQISKQLVLSPYTINSHIQSIYGKLGIKSRSAATRIAVDHHLLSQHT